MLPRLVKTESALYESRSDPRDPRMGELITIAEPAREQEALAGADIVIVGCPEDRGIIAGGGRPGASQGPSAIRRNLARLTPGFNPDIMRLYILDIGDIVTENDSLEATHAELEAAVAAIASSGSFPLVLGGGHDLTFPGFRGFSSGRGLMEGELGAVNIDSHLDVRDLERGVNSGTPFFRVLTEMTPPALQGKNFVEYGVQEAYNSPWYYNWIRNAGATVMTFKDVAGRPMEMFLQALRIAGESSRSVAVSIDIDAVRNNDAPGASSSNPSGLSAFDLEKIAYLVGKTERVGYLDIMEMSPPLDQDRRTASLCASVIFWFLKGFCERR